MSKLNSFGKLKWTCTGFVKSLEFLELTISIKNERLHFKTFQKQRNLYLYIPPISAHSRDMVRGLIFGRLRSYYKHNTDIEDYYTMALLLTRRLLSRGWDWEYIRPIIRDAHYSLTNKRTTTQLKKPEMRSIIIHSTYHPRGIQRQDIREIYMETLGQEIKNPLIIAQSRPKNLRNLLCRSQLPIIEGCNPSDYI